MVRAWRLVGRETELEHIAKLRAAGSGGVVIVGEPGVGKTRLAVEALADAVGSGAVTVRLAATAAAATIPLGALAPILPDLDQGVNPLHAGRRALKDVAAGCQLVVMVDDAHLLDEVSATLVLQLALAGEAFVVATVRSGEPTPEPVLQLWKDGHAERMELGLLRAAQVDQLVAAILESEVEPALTAAVERISEGNPLMVRELLFSARDSRSVRLDDGVWRMTGPLPVSERLIELVAQRLAVLDRDETEALELVVEGEPLGVAMLAGLVGPEVVEQLELNGLVEIRTDGLRTEVWVAHPFHGEVVRARMSPLRRRAVLAALADAIETPGPARAGDLLRVATWRLESRAPCDPAILLDAAVHSMRALSWQAAARFARAAWERAPSWETGVLLGIALLRSDQHAEADGVFDATGRLATGDLQLVEAMGWRAEAIHRGLAEAARARAVLADVRAAVRDPAALAHLTVSDATIDVYEGENARALRAVEPFLDPANPMFLRAAFVAAFASLFDGQTERSHEIASSALELHLRLWDQEVLHDPPGVHGLALAQGQIEAGAYRDAEPAIAAEHVRSIEQGDQVGQWWGEWAMGRVRLGQGRVRSAATNLRRAADHWIGVVGKLLPGAELVTALALAGELQGAHEASDRCASVPSRTAELWLAEGRAWLAVAEGDLGTGRTMLDEAADHGIACRQRGLAARALHGLARIGHPEDALERLERIASETESPIIPAWVAHTSALVSRDPSALSAAASTFEHMGAMLVAAEASADAARAYRDAGATRRATAAAQRAARLLDHCEGAMTPAVSGLDGLTPLTPREQEIAVLAANGLPTKVIAARLFLSDRTVGNHLQRIYAKLGVTGRIELPGALGLDD